MLKRIAVLMCVFAIAGCSEPEPQVIDLDKAAADAGLSLEDYEVHENGAIEIKSKADDKSEDSILWYQDDLSEPVEKVGVFDANAIIESANIKPSEIIDSSDTEGEPKQIYLFNSKSSISAQLEHSPNSIILQWYMYSDEPTTLEYSQKSIEDAYKLARAMAGMEGYDAIMYLSNGGKYRSKSVGGYPTTGQCNGGICFIRMDLNG